MSETGPDGDTDESNSDPHSPSTVGALRERVVAILAPLRYRSPTHIAAVLGAGVLGLLLVSVHWAGLVLAGGLIGIVSRNLREAVLTAMGFGVVVIAVFVGSRLAIVDRVLAMEPIIYVTVASALALPVLGSLVRGVVD